MKNGVPYDKAERYARLAETYMDDKTDFKAALTKAVTDFPFAPAPASAGSAGQDGSTGSGESVPDADKIAEIFNKRG